MPQNLGTQEAPVISSLPGSGTYLGQTVTLSTDNNNQYRWNGTYWELQLVDSNFTPTTILSNTSWRVPPNKQALAALDITNNGLIINSGIIVLAPPSIPNSIVAGTIGSSTQIPVLTYNSHGDLTSVTSIAVSGGSGSSRSFGFFAG